MTAIESLARFDVFTQPGFLSAQECAALRRLAENARGHPAEIMRDGASRLDQQFRRGSCIGLSDHGRNLHQRLLELRPTLDRHFGERLSACDRPKLLVYRRGDFFKPHRDRGSDERLPSVLRRRITALIFLDDGDGRSAAYGGGELFLYHTGADLRPHAYRARVVGEGGLLLAFRADVFHEVTRVRWGDRRTIVSWFH